MIGFVNYEYLRMLEKKNNIPVFFIDRDGVINKRMPPHQHVLKWEDFQILTGVYDALRICNDNRIPAIMVSNQRCISLGTLTVQTLNGINDKMQDQFRSHGVHIDGFFYCPHGDEDGCRCRKPGVGLLEEAEKELSKCGISIDISCSWMIGDENYDIESGNRFGLNTALIGCGANTSISDIQAESFLDAIKKIVKTGDIK